MPLRAATTASPKPTTIERWKNEDGEVLAVQPLSSVEALEQKGRRKRLVVFDLNGTLCEPNEPVDEDPAIFLLSKTRSKRNDPLT